MPAKLLRPRAPLPHDQGLSSPGAGAMSISVRLPGAPELKTSQFYGKFSSWVRASLQLQTKEPVQSVANSVCPQGTLLGLLELGGRKKATLNSFLALEGWAWFTLCRDEGSCSCLPLAIDTSPILRAQHSRCQSRAMGLGTRTRASPCLWDLLVLKGERRHHTT